MRIQIINGPNLNLLGKRETSIYGSQSFEKYLNFLKEKYPTIDFEYFQSNIEGEIIDKIQETGFDPDSYRDGILLNAGGYTHTSVAIADAIAAVTTPVIEVHISNVFQREDFRHVSLIGKNCKGSISGFGLNSYEIALFAVINEK